MAAVRPDYLVTVGYKWLLGPYGLGYLYVAPHWRENGVPIEQSWLTRAGSENFARLTEYTDSFRAGARRFDMGEFPQFVLAPMAIAALEQVLVWGVDRIQATLSRLTEEVECSAVAMGAPAVPKAHRLGHLVGIRPRGGVRHDQLSALLAARVYVSIRGDAIRVAPHLYNDDGDISRFLGVLRRSMDH